MIHFEKRYNPSYETYVYIFRKEIPMEFIKQILLTVFIIVSVVYAMQMGRDISNSYIKMAAYFCPSGAEVNGQIQKCFPSQDGTKIIWNCTDFQKTNFPTLIK